MGRDLAASMFRPPLLVLGGHSDLTPGVVMGSKALVDPDGDGVNFDNFGDQLPIHQPWSALLASPLPEFFTT